MLYPYIDKSFDSDGQVNAGIMNLKVTWRVSDIVPTLPVSLKNGETVLYALSISEDGGAFTFIARNPLSGGADRLYRKIIGVDFINGLASFHVPSDTATDPVYTSDMESLLVPTTGDTNKKLWSIASTAVVMIIDGAVLQTLVSDFTPVVVAPYNVIFDPIPEAVHIGGVFNKEGTTNVLRLTNNPVKGGVNIVPSMNWVIRDGGIGLDVNSEPTQEQRIMETAIKYINGIKPVDGNINIKVL